jgi:hypothetical protein
MPFFSCLIAAISCRADHGGGDIRAQTVRRASCVVVQFVSGHGVAIGAIDRQEVQAEVLAVTPGKNYENRRFDN